MNKQNKKYKMNKIKQIIKRKSMLSNQEINLKINKNFRKFQHKRL